MASRVASQSAKVTKHLPNKRERAAAEFGQLSDTEEGSWGAGQEPKTIQEAINRMAAVVAALNNGPIPPEIP